MGEKKKMESRQQPARRIRTRQMEEPSEFCKQGRLFALGIACLQFAYFIYTVLYNRCQPPPAEFLRDGFDYNTLLPDYCSLFQSDLSILPGVKATSEITVFNNYCYPCTASGYAYCMDNDLCYSDNKGWCKPSLPIGYPLSCKDVNRQIFYTPACKPMIEIDSEYRMKMTIWLEPRTGCGFYLRGWKSTLGVNYKTPVSMFVKNYTMTNHDEVDTHFPEQLDDSKTITFKVWYSRMFFYFVNWDQDRSFPVTIDMYESWNFNYPTPDRSVLLAGIGVSCGGLLVQSLLY